MKAFWKYTAARLALFLLTYYVVWTVAATRWTVQVLDPFVLLAAIILSGVISLFALRSLREDVAQQFSQRASRRAQRAEKSRDSDLD